MTTWQETDEVKRGSATGQSFASFRNQKNYLGSQIEDLIRPFLVQYDLSPQSVKIIVSHAGCQVEVIL